MHARMQIKARFSSAAAAAESGMSPGQRLVQTPKGPMSDSQREENDEIKTIQLQLKKERARATKVMTMMAMAVAAVCWR